VTLAVVAGLTTGLGLAGLFFGLRRRRPSIDRLFEALDQEKRAVPPEPGVRDWRPHRRLGDALGNAIADHPLVQTRLLPLLRQADVPLGEFCSQVILGSVVGVMLPLMFWALLTAGGLAVSLMPCLVAAIAFATLGALLPIGVLSSQAASRRRAARKSVGTLLDLVTLCLAGGIGIEGSLHAASRVSDDEVSRRLLNALMLARDSGEPPWEALGRVGTEFGVDELAELAAAVGLAGSHGARIRQTLAAKAASIRRHELADAEAEANAVTERLFLPGVLMLLGFLLFIGYPAVARIASGL